MPPPRKPLRSGRRRFRFPASPHLDLLLNATQRVGSLVQALVQVIAAYAECDERRAWVLEAREVAAELHTWAGSLASAPGFLVLDGDWLDPPGVVQVWVGPPRGPRPRRSTPSRV